jgi:hypothetical protein
MKANPEAVKVNASFVKKLVATRLPAAEEDYTFARFMIDNIKKLGPHAYKEESERNMIDFFKEQEQLVGYVDTNSGGLLITDMIWSTHKTAHEQIILDLEGLDQVRIPVKSVIQGGKRRLIIEIDEALDRTKDQDVVDVEGDEAE